MTNDGTILSATWAECHALGLASLKDSAKEIAMIEIIGNDWDKETIAAAGFDGWNVGIHGDQDDRCCAIDNAGWEMLCNTWLAATAETAEILLNL